MQHSVATTDWMMVERSGVSYKVNGQQIIDYFPSAPAGAAGPITDVNLTQLILGDDTNLDQFVNGDAIRMVDINGSTASYIPQTNAITAITTENNYNASIFSDGFTEKAVNFVNGTGGSHQSPIDNGPGADGVIWRIPGVTALGSQNTISFYISNGSTSSYKSATIQIAPEDNSPYDTFNFTIGPGAYVSFNTSGNVPEQFYIKVYNPLNEYILVSDFKIGGQLVNIQTPVSTLTFSPNNADLKYFKVGDTIDNGATIVDVNTTANQMQITSNTYSIGDTVTGPVKSGTGNFVSYSGTTVQIANSNDQWIGNDNRLGEEFFIKPNSNRQGLAVLRAKAANLASTFNLTTTYQTGDVVLFNDCYWVRDNGSWLKISESTTTY